MTDITKAIVCAILSGMVLIKDSLLQIKNRSPGSGGSEFLSQYLNDPLPYVRCHITKYAQTFTPCYNHVNFFLIYICHLAFNLNTICLTPK